ncbi:MAG: hypothetical protein R2864_04105 [Syntrophotaleaceae bacterium]
MPPLAIAGLALWLGGRWRLVLLVLAGCCLWFCGPCMCELSAKSAQRQGLEEQLREIENRRDEARERRGKLSNLRQAEAGHLPVEMVRMQKNLEQHRRLLAQLKWKHWGCLTTRSI